MSTVPVESTATAGSKVRNVLSATSLASGISGVVDKVTGIFGSIGSFTKELTGVSLPLVNPLHAYATYNYIISFGCLTQEEYNFPDASYKAGKPVSLICRSGHGDPNNRVLTPYGKFEFYIENLVLNSLVGFSDGANSNITDISFEVVEPYSMGMFSIACQQIAQELGHENHFYAPYIMIIEFRGNKESGQMDYIPNTTVHIPLQISDMTATVDEQGTKYKCSAMPFQQTGMADIHTNLESDTSVRGKTVQETLQTGEKSLQAVVNQRKKQHVDQGIATTQDEIVILFPVNVASSASDPTSSQKENDDGATTAPVPDSSQSVTSKLEVSRSSKNGTLVQQDGACNALGNAKLGFSEARKGDAPYGKDNEIYDEKSKGYIRGKNTIDPEVSEFRFSQDSNIINAINQVLISSDFIKDAFDESKLSDTGMRDWWRIETETYIMGPVDKFTGQAPKLVVYRVVPYQAHASNLTSPNSRAPGFDNLKKQAVKEYNYIYTGKNADVIDFKIEIQNGFFTTVSADAVEKSQDVKTAPETSQSFDNFGIPTMLTGENSPPTKLGSNPTSVRYNNTNMSTDKQGGGGVEAPGTRAARAFMDAVTKGTDLVNIELGILGDPYFLVNSGVGNYTSAPSQYSNLNADGSMNYQNGEVDILVNFRTPSGIDQNTGLYNFTPSDLSSPVMQFSGLYQVTEVESRFELGKFTQKLIGMRRPGQEFENESAPSQMFNLSGAVKNLFDSIFGD